MLFRSEARSSKLASLVVKLGALVVILAIDPQFSIDLQLIGGVIILQTLPAVALGLYTKWFHRWGLVAGWLVGMGLGMWMLYQIPNPATNHKHFGGSAFALSKWFDPTTIGLNKATTMYVGFIAVLANVVVAILITLLCKALRAPDGIDLTTRDDYFADEGDPRVAGGPTPDQLDTSQEPTPVA